MIRRPKVLLGMLLAGQLAAAPFHPRFYLRNGELAQTGDLHMEIPLATLKIDPSLTIPLWLDHELQCDDYGGRGSSVRLQPLQTSIAPAPHGRLIWREPGGDRITLKERKFPFPVHGPYAETSNYFAAMYEGVGAVAWSASSGDTVVLSQHFWLHYTHGQLRSFVTPAGRKLNVTSEGSRIVRLVDEAGRELLAYSLRAGRGELRLGQTIMEVVLNQDARITAVRRPGIGEIAVFEYGNDGALARYSARGEAVDLEWSTTAIPRSTAVAWVKPYHLARAGLRRYDLRVGHNTVVLAADHGPEGKRIMRVKNRYGRIIAVTQ